MIDENNFPAMDSRDLQQAIRETSRKKIDDKIAGNVRMAMDSRELQQAIRETFEMWIKTDPPEGDNLEKHLNTLLDLQLMRARSAYVEK